jgi:hypothetical protein
MGLVLFDPEQTATRTIGVIMSPNVKRKNELAGSSANGTLFARLDGIANGVWRQP